MDRACRYRLHLPRAFEALRRLGLPHADIEAAGIRLLHTQMPLSIDPNNIRNFARGLDEIIVVEEKNPTLEWLVKDALYGGPHQPRVVGKRHEDRRPLMPDHGILDAARWSRACGNGSVPASPTGSLHRHHRSEKATAAALGRSLAVLAQDVPQPFDQGPDDTLVGAGIGCHGMVLLMDDSKVGDIAGITAMGAEGSSSSAWPRSLHVSISSRTSATAPSSTRPTRDPGIGRGGDEHDLQAPLQRHGRHDRWPGRCWRPDRSESPLRCSLTASPRCSSPPMM